MKTKNKVSETMRNIFKHYHKEIFAGAIFLLMYFPIFIWMWDRWFARDSYYSHGFLVPAVTIYLIVQIKDELKKIKRSESAWGMRLIVVGIVFHILSSTVRVYFASGLSMIIVLCGLILHFFGARIFKKISFPLAFLLFMVPLPMVVIANISFKLKLFAAEIATVLLNNMRIPAIRDGSIIKMRSTQVVVDDVCSGLRSLISLTALGSIFAYWMKATVIPITAAGSVFAYWMRSTATKRILLFLSTIPIAIITNVCRVILLASISEIWGAEYAVGFVHDASGFMVFGLAFIMLFSVGKVLE